MYTRDIPREKELTLPGGLNQRFKYHLQPKTEETKVSVGRKSVLKGYQEKQSKQG